MNTLNDALKPCPMCGSEVKLISGFEPIGHHFIDCDACGLSGKLTDTAAEAIAAWNLRANTPESSAAQGATEDASCLCLAIQVEKESIKGNEMAVAVATGAMLCAQAIDKALSSQPSDATAQPIDLTDERAAFENEFPGARNIRYVANSYSDQKYNIGWVAWQARALLANTAQGKPEHIELIQVADKLLSSAYASGMNGLDFDMLDAKNKLISALAAKKD